VYIASRSREKAELAFGDLKRDQADADVRFLACDLGDLESVKAAAAEFLQFVIRVLDPEGC
jgi:NAD(P)-dependent dehydrogenase (short-subunit alcohol dehydrogenase family)